MSKGERIAAKKAGEISECLIGKGSLMEGMLVCKGLVRVEGGCKGRLLTEGTLVIAQDAVVEADIEAEDVIVAGSVSGTISAKNLVHLSPTAKVKADIRSRGFKIEAGALYRGTVIRRIAG